MGKDLAHEHFVAGVMPSVPSILNSSIFRLHNSKLINEVYKEICVEVSVEKVVYNFIRKLI